MSSPFDAVLEAPFGKLGVRVADGAVRELVYLPESTPAVDSDDALIRRLAHQLDAYYADPDAPFDVPLAPVGTAFQHRVWRAICAVPRGRTTTYGAIAKAIGSVPRAVGQACGDNGLPIVIPCHRVVSASGIGGFAHHVDGYLLNIKHWLLRHEGVMLI
ncbi:Methylated-DNA--protein-cysteine methyltransferase [Ralstonia condita]|jgi:methylated-DNA-[protein]-cysteine S-methyltransferase|uniref:Methylated-DNA--protein-cysteine methyltransferase n=1 Tax=Ralstonia condita TaxID=3058600 RepID=A0ABN9I8S9_9RALS|nr:methylated-DNA--[protein]-cysteine S-methyltransferase [Ralstonia sp. LMG 7141]MDE2202778.1 methylated-DNA--[protein]-cysteine S-methyltransferase [Burkholderiaceae bacterium]CAJ0774760.1 Methylated-DNA--protein-cysteine methyltransferase [Ralstonia sp. LMG 7141]